MRQPNDAGMEWYYADGGERRGPITPQAFEDLIAAQTVGLATLVWSKPMTEWQPYSTIMTDTARSESGGRYWKRDLVEFEGKYISPENKELYFQHVREGVAQPGQFVYGGFWIRFVAKLIDGIILWLVSLVPNMFLAFLLIGSFSFRPKPTGGLGAFFAYQGVVFLVGVAIAISYQLFFLRKFSATPGKMALGLKVIRSDGSRLSVGRIFGRYFAEILSGLTLSIGYIMAGPDEEKRALHDRICETRVIKSR